MSSLSSGEAAKTKWRNSLVDTWDGGLTDRGKNFRDFCDWKVEPRSPRRAGIEKIPIRPKKKLDPPGGADRLVPVEAIFFQKGGSF